MNRIILTFSFFFVCFFHLAQYSKGHTTITFNDPARTGGFGSGGGPGRQIQTELYYPSPLSGENTPISQGQFPLITFGHGFAMSWDAYQNIWEHYVPLGYIVAFVRTEGSLIPSPSHQDFALDMAIVTQKIQALNFNSTSLFEAHLNGKSIAMGHSMGGGSAVLAAQNNPLFDGYVGLAPAETNPSAIAACPNILCPSIIFSGSSDGVTPPSQHHRPMYDAIVSGCKSYVSITGGAHCYFANTNFNCDFGESTTSSGISISRIQQQQKTYSILDPWLEYICKQSCNGLVAFHNGLNATTGTVNETNCPNTIESATIFYDGQSTFYTIDQGIEFQWFNFGSPIENSNNDTLIISSGDELEISLSIITEWGCAMSDAISVSSNIEQNDFFDLIIQQENLVLMINAQENMNGKCSILNLNGSLISEASLIKGESKLMVNQLTQGLYLLFIETEKHSQLKRIYLHN